MIKECKTKYPYAEKCLTQLRQERKTVPLLNFMKMLAYEKVRSSMRSLFSITSSDQEKQISEKIDAKTPEYAQILCQSYSEHHGHREKSTPLNEEKIKTYISFLAKNILQNSAIARYQKKRLKKASKIT